MSYKDLRVDQHKPGAERNSLYPSMDNMWTQSLAHPIMQERKKFNKNQGLDQPVYSYACREREREREGERERERERERGREREGERERK